MAKFTAEQIEQFTEGFERLYRSKNNFVLHEIKDVTKIKGAPTHIDILVMESLRKDRTMHIVTCGMSAVEHDCKTTELMVEVPPNMINGLKESWVINTLEWMKRSPWTDGSLNINDTVELSMPVNENLTDCLVTVPFHMLDNPACAFVPIDGKMIRLFQLVPIYRKERDWLWNSTDPQKCIFFIEKLKESGYTPADFDRPCLF